MNIFRTSSLVERFRTGQYHERETGPYFVATFILASILNIQIPVLMETNETVYSSVISMVESILIFLIHLAGLMFIRECNGGTFSNHFLHKFFALGWVIGVRCVIVSIAFILPALIIQALILTDQGYSLLTPLFISTCVIFSQILFYILLGRAIRKSASNPASQAAAHEAT